MIDLEELGSSPSWCFWLCRGRNCRIRSGLNSRQLWGTQRQAERRAAWPGTARHGMVRYGTQPHPPPRLYFLAGVTRGAYFYGLYYFAFLECALPGVNPRPQFGQCREVPFSQKCSPRSSCVRTVTSDPDLEAEVRFLVLYVHALLS